MVILDTGRHMLQGRVMDGNDEPVAAASITLDWAFRNNGLRSSSSRKATTDQNGSFFFTGLGPDLHTMQVSAAGFKTAVQTIDVGAGPNEIVVEFEYEDQ